MSAQQICEVCGGTTRFVNYVVDDNPVSGFAFKVCVCSTNRLPNPPAAPIPVNEEGST